MSTPLIVPQDMTLWLVNRLRLDLASHPQTWANTAVVATSMPATIPARLVQVRADGGPRLSLTRDLPRYGINVIATSEAEVNDLTAVVRGYMWRLRSVPPIKDVTETGPISVTDPSRRPWRYLTYELLTRIEEA